MVLFLLSAFAQDTFFVNVKSSQWNVVFRSSVTDTRIERMAARCGEEWVNACASWVTEPQRRGAFAAGLAPTTRVMGTDYASCRSLRLPRSTPADLQRTVLRPDARAFCEVLKPGSTSTGELGFRGGSVGQPAAMAPPPRPLPPPPPAPRGTSIGGAPSTVTTRDQAVRTPTTMPGGAEIPTVSTSTSLADFGLEDLDEPLDPKEQKRRDKEERKKQRKAEEPVLRERSLPR